MPEKFPKIENLAAKAETEEAAFWKKEMEEWLSNKDEKYKQQSEDELYSTLVNNIHGWVQSDVKGAYYGAKRSQDAMEFYQEQQPEKLKEIKRLMADIDEYIETHHLKDFVRGIAEQQAEQARVYAKAVKKGDMKILNDFKPNLTQGEILEFKKDLYHAMRLKGHPGELLRT